MTAINRGPKDADENLLFNIKELEWFSRHAYNLGLRYAGDGDLDHTVSVLASCVNIIRKFPLDVESPQAEDLSLKTLFCQFIMASATVSIARAQDNIEEQAQYYLMTRHNVESFDEELQRRLDGFDRTCTVDILDKFVTLLVFDFEAALYLQKWDGLGQIVRKAAVCQNLSAYQAMADCLLRSRVPAAGLLP